MPLFIGTIIGISLSMDAFSLALAYGTQIISKEKCYLLSIIVGIYHFFMPLLGLFVGKKIIKLLPIKANVFVFIVLFLIGIEMIVESFKESNIINRVNFLEMIVFGLAVSIDSFSLGLSIKEIYNKPYILAAIFAILSSLFTIIGLYLGKYINKKIGPFSTILGGFILIIIGIFYLV